MPCQDASEIRVCEGGLEGSVLVLVVSDGAGSAPMSQEGSLRAVRSVIQSATNYFAEGRAVAELDESELRRWFEIARLTLEDEALSEERPVRDYACTLLCAVIDDRTAAYAQLGDGAIVAGCGDDVEAMFWPQQGEFANTTYFITHPEHFTRMTTRVHAEVPERLALMSDGLQNLALRFADQTAHAGFFSPLFDGLKRQPEGQAEALLDPLQEFLDSPRINARTDDDKSLLLAVRELPAPGESVETPASAAGPEAQPSERETSVADRAPPVNLLQEDM
jgi:serine/threonine protein phosphatase PrpC